MATLRDKIVTFDSFRLELKPGSAESRAMAEAQRSPEARLALARYGQVMERLRQETEVVGPDVMITVPDREVSLAQSRLARDAAAVRGLASGGQEVKFGTGVTGGDVIGWIRSLFDHVDRRDAHPLVRPPSTDPQPLPDSARVGLTADWGTGLYGAPKSGESIRRMGAARPFDLLMHLGDVYYSGTEDEVQERFLDIWPIDAGQVNRALNSNHEMYSGGFGYFTRILPAFGQASSYFALANANWLLVGLDTAYVDHDIDNEQVSWLNLAIKTAQSDPARRRKVVLFSHQQPFSRLDSQGPKLQKALQHLLQSQAITAWYWGHEHECVIYDAHPQWGLLGRCLGNGGIPSSRNSQVKNAPVDAQHPGAAGCTWKRLAATADSPGCIALDGRNMEMKKKDDQEKFGPHGFMTLELEGAELRERVFLSDGTELFANTIR